MSTQNEYCCECGCGQEVTIFKGKPRRFVQGHHTKMRSNREMHSKRMLGNTLFQGKKHSEATKKIMSDNQKGEKNSVWNGGRTNAAGGYISILCKNHPFADVNGRVKEERLIMEKHIGRYLSSQEIVHHRNEIKTDNRITNLQIVTALQHGTIHHKEKKHALGYTFSDEAKKKRSEQMKGHVITLETRQKIAKTNRGQKRTEETRHNMSISATGRKMSIETRQKMSEAGKKAWKIRKVSSQCL